MALFRAIIHEMNAAVRRLIRNMFFLSASIAGAILIMRMGTVDSLLASIDGLTQVGSFIAGIFFTSLFTTAPAMVVLGEIALTVSPWTVAAFGAVGAVVGDFLLFLIVRQGLKKDIEFLIGETGLRRLRKIAHTRLVHHLLPLLGALVLASPLPDEIGLAMLGFSKIDKDRFLLISFVMNFLGILAIGYAARAIIL
jgi:hypothetical protein